MCFYRREAISVVRLWEQECVPLFSLNVRLQIHYQVQGLDHTAIPIYNIFHFILAIHADSNNIKLKGNVQI